MSYVQIRVAPLKKIVKKGVSAGTVTHILIQSMQHPESTVLRTESEDVALPAVC